MTAVDQAILERKDQFGELLAQVGEAIGIPSGDNQPEDILAFNNFTKDPGWGDWYKSDSWGKK